MLSFLVLDPDGTPAREFPVRQAYTFGADDLPMLATLTFEQGVIRCRRSISDAAGISVQFPITFPDQSRPSLLTLQTCLLPDREEPYLLSLELARCRVMLFLNKLEDWDLFELPAEDPIMVQFERARRLYSEALVMHRGRHASLARADRAAREALALTIDAGERLALAAAERMHPQRQSGRLYAEAAEQLAAITAEAPPPGAPVHIPGTGLVVLSGPAAIGCAIDPGAFGEPLQNAASLVCDFVTMPMRWIDLEPTEGEYSFGPTDRWIEWAVRTAKLPVCAGPLIDFRPECVPEWLFIWENDYETLRDLVAEHVQSVVTRYRRTVSRWTVVSGLNANSHFKLSVEQVMDLTRVCVLLVRKLHPQARIQVDIAQPWGEYFAANRRSVPPLLYAETLVQANVPFDILGLRVQMGQSRPGQAVRDLMLFSTLLDRYALLEKPIALSALGVPSAPAPATDLAPAENEDLDDDAPAAPIDPGTWRQPWSEPLQSEWLAQALHIALAKPYVGSVCWQQLADAASGASAPEMPFGGLLNAAGQLKPAARRLAQLRMVLRGGAPAPQG